MGGWHGRKWEWVLNMKAQFHFKDALAWMTKAPPMPSKRAPLVPAGVVVAFPSERIVRRPEGIGGGGAL